MSGIEFKKKYIVILAKCAWISALIAANSACTMPYYDPEHPEELKRLKKKH